ncbi:hypothetical protein M3Y99_00669800 [Aphelenchoides fujianensis]|nr:hypothetical protein M3Y99_00669800 [Aphelenchoides fujianensis]
MDAKSALVCCVLLLFIGHVGLFFRNRSHEWAEMTAKYNYSTQQWSGMLMFVSILYGVLVFSGIVNSQRGNDRKEMEYREGVVCIFGTFIVLWLVAALVLTIVVSQWFFAFGAYCLLNAAATALMLSAFQHEVKKYEEFIAGTRLSNALYGRRLTDDDAHALYELLTQRHLLSPPSAWSTNFEERLNAWHVDDFIAISGWIRKLESIASQDPQMAVTLGSLIPQMQRRCEKYDLTEEKRAQLRRLVQFGEFTVVPGTDGVMGLCARLEKTVANVQQKQTAVSIAIDEPPPKYEEKKAKDAADVV